MVMSYKYRPTYEEEYEEDDKERYYDDERRSYKEDSSEDYDGYDKKRHCRPTGKKCKVIINTIIFCEDGMYKKTREYEVDCDEHKPIVNRIDCAKCQECREKPKCENKKHK